MRKIIRMERIGRIASEIANAPVEIHLTTELKTLIAFLSHHDGTFDILVNANICKTEVSIVTAVAHEVTHIATERTEHDNVFTEQLDELCTIFEQKMGYPTSTLSNELKALGTRQVSDGKY